MKQLNCIYCDSDTKVIDCAQTKATVIRRRKCLECGACYYTQEMLIDDEEGRHILYKVKKKAYLEQREHT